MKRYSSHLKYLPVILRSSLLLVATILSFYVVIGQNFKENLQKEYKKLKADIAEIETALAKKSSEKQRSVHELRSLEQKISKQEQLIKNLQAQVNTVKKQIAKTEAGIEKSKEEIAEMKMSYAKMIITSYENMSGLDQMMFVFSAKNFNEAYNRFGYLKKYAEARKRQGETIQRTIDELQVKVESLRKSKSELDVLVGDQLRARKKLEVDKIRVNEWVKQLTADEGKLKDQIAQKEKAARALNKQIQDIIRKEIEAAKAAAKAKAAKEGKKPDEVLALTPAEKALSADFQNNRGRLPWPVERGHVIEKFGKQAHPTLRGVYLNNNGVDIKTSNEAEVRACFGGEVISVFFLPTTQYSIIVKHGEYYTVYSNLKDVIVEKGEKIKTKQTIGVAYFNKEESLTKVHFEVWKGIEKLNPSLWIAYK